MASFGKEIREFIQAMGVGQRLVTSMSDAQYRRLRQQLLQTQIDKASDPERIQLEKDNLRARTNRMNRGPDPELTKNRKLRGQLLQKQIDLLDKEPAQVPSAVDDVPTGYGTPPSQSIPKSDKVSALDLEDEELEDQPTQLASRGGAIKRVKTYAAGGAVEADDDMDSDVGGEGDELIEDDEELPEDEEGLDESTMSRGYSPLAAQDAVVAGLKYAKQATGMEPAEQGSQQEQPREALPLEVSAQSRQPRVQSVRGYLRGMGAASPDEVDAVRKAIDPQGKMSEAERNMAALAHVWEFKLKQGDPQGAARAAASLLQHYRNVSNRYQALASVAAQNGDLDGTLRMILKSHAAVPDGRDIKIQKRQDGSIAYSMVDQSGKVVEQNVASPDQILAWASKGAIPGFDDLISRAGEQPRQGRTSATGRQGRGAQRDVLSLADREKASGMVPDADPEKPYDFEDDARHFAGQLIQSNDLSGKQALAIAQTFASNGGTGIKIEKGDTGYLAKLADGRTLRLSPDAFQNLVSLRLQVKAKTDAAAKVEEEKAAKTKKRGELEDEVSAKARERKPGSGWLPSQAGPAPYGNPLQELRSKGRVSGVEAEPTPPMSEIDQINAARRSQGLPPIREDQLPR